MFYFLTMSKQMSFEASPPTKCQLHLVPIAQAHAYNNDHLKVILH